MYYYYFLGIRLVSLWCNILVRPPSDLPVPTPHAGKYNYSWIMLYEWSDYSVALQFINKAGFVSSGLYKQPRYWLAPMAYGLMFATTYIATYTAVTLLPISLHTVLVSTSPIFAIMLSRFVMKLKPSPDKVSNKALSSECSRHCDILPFLPELKKLWLTAIIDDDVK
jgi:drug/metabolite transporter (DMT)-like permease